MENMNYANAENLFKSNNAEPEQERWRLLESQRMNMIQAALSKQAEARRNNQK